MKIALDVTVKIDLAKVSGSIGFGILCCSEAGTFSYDTGICIHDGQPLYHLHGHHPRRTPGVPER